MGKNLIIKGANFSENAIGVERTLVNGATANWEIGYWSSPGTTGLANGWHYVAAIDISQYVGRTMMIRSCNTSQKGMHGDWCWIVYTDNTSEKLFGDGQPHSIVNETVEYGTFVVPDNASLLYMSVRAGGTANYDITTSNSYLIVCAD